MSLIFGNLLLAMARVFDFVFGLLVILLFVRALISWVSPDPNNIIVQFLYKTTEPILAPIRRLIPFGPIDFSPIIAFILIIFLQSFLVASLRDLGYHMRHSHSQGPKIEQVF